MTRSLHVPPMEGQMYATVKDFGSADRYLHGGDKGGTLTSHIEDANIITSMVKDNVTMHKLVVDIDLPAVLVPSSTPGHFHLYIDHEIPAEAYWTLLRAMAAAGLVESNYAEASIDQGRSGVRLPWVKKEVSETCAVTHKGTSKADSVTDRELASLARLFNPELDSGEDESEDFNP